MSGTSTAVNRRGCYCGLWDTKPDVLRAQGVPEGHCGHCQTCGRPGHTRHFPGGAPYTGSWCDRHYRMTAILHPLGVPGAALWALLVALTVLACLRACAR